MLSSIKLYLQALERYRKTDAPLKCKQCTSAQEEKERQAAAAKASASGNKTTEELIICAACKQSLSTSSYNRNQLTKKVGARCRICVEKAIHAEEQSRVSSKQNALEEVKQKIKEAEAKGDVKEKLKYESQLSALEAEHVTGLKPVLMGRGRGSWRGRGRGR